MDTITINQLLKEYKCFKGVYALDKLPTLPTIPFTLIANTHPSHMPGEHWVSISINKDGSGRYFDSFGLPPLKEEILKFLDKNCLRGWKHNKITLQNVTSDTCGHYCVLWVIFKCQGLSEKRFLSLFNNNTLNNDKLMKEIFKNFSLAKDL